MKERVNIPASGARCAALAAEAGALHRTGRLDEAARRYQAALALQPRHFDCLHMLGVLRAQQGRIDEAVELLGAAVALNPTSAAALTNLGLALNLGQRPAEALAPLQRAVSLDAANPIAQNNLGIALQAFGRTEAAVAAFERAVALKPAYVEALANLGGALQAAGRREEAVAILRRALAHNPGFAQARVNLGVVLHALERRSEARAAFARALAADPRCLEAHLRLGAMELEVGRVAEARGHYERARAVQPDNARVLFEIAQCGRVTAQDPCLVALESLAVNEAALGPDQQILLHFALGKAYADIGRNDRSFDHYLAGNACKRRAINYDETGEFSRFERIGRVFSADFLRARAGVGAASPVPVFILGMMRSGSTLVEQVLASHPAVFAGGERADFDEAYKSVRKTIDLSATYPEAIPLLGDDDLRRIGEAYLARIAAAASGSGAARITDKMPGNFTAIGLIRLALPGARIIHTVRDPVDTCLSCFSKLFASDQPFTYDLGELGRYYRAYELLMAHWRSVLPPDAMLEVRYEDLVTDFERQARRIVTYCGLEWHDACLSFHTTARPVATASQVQVRQPLYTTSVGRARPAPAVLRPLLDGLGIEAERGA